MKTKFFTILSFVLFTFFNLKAQQAVEVSGQIKDVESKKALEFCTVSAFNKKDSLITGTMSDEGGYFTFHLPKGTYKFKISFIGYKTDSISSTFVGSDKFLGVFKLKQEVKILGEYAVKTNSKENLIDREVQIVTEKMKAGTSSTKEVLDKIDGVEYDRYSKAIKVDNSDKVIILVDGVEKDQEYVKNLTPERLKKIEIIRDPSGKYALEGYTAVINIILKNDYQGTELQLNNENLIDVDSKNANHILLSNGSSATLNYTYNKINLYAKLRSNISNFTFKQENERHFIDSNIIIKMIPINNRSNENKYRENYNNIIYGFDYNVNPKNSFSFEGNYTFQPKSLNLSHSIDTMQFIKNGKIDETLNDVESKNSSQSQYYSLFYNGKINEKHSFNANITALLYADEAENIRYDMLKNPFNPEYTSNTKNKIKSNIEYMYIINEKHNVQIGYGNSYEKLENTYTIERKDFKGTSISDFRNKIYSYYGFQPNKKFGVKIGIAAELSSPELSIKDSLIKRVDYPIYLPYADVKYKLNNLFDFKLKYRTNSNYPSIDQVTSFTSMIERATVKIGNPLLKPDITHKLSLQINIMGGLAKVEPYFNYSNNLISQTFELKNDTTVVFSYNNIDFYSEKGIMINFTVPFGKSIFWQNDFNIFSPKLKYNNHTNKYIDFTMNSQIVYVNEPKDFVGGFKYQKGMRKYPMAQGYNKWNNDFWLMFAQKSFFNKSLSVTLAYITPIMLGVGKKQGTIFETDKYKDSRFINIGDILKNIAIVELTYRFNKGKTVKKKEKDVEIMNEKTSKGLI